MRALSLICLVFLFAATARAQGPGSTGHPEEVTEETGREAFLEGIGLAADGRWEQAHEAFVRSYRLSGSAVALYNVASALRALDRAGEAQDALRELLTMPTLDQETRVRAEALRADVREMLARVVLRGVPAGEATLVLDGTSRSLETTRPVILELDPGTHALRIEVTQASPWTWSGELLQGERVRLDAAFEPTRDDGSTSGSIIAATITAVALLGAAAVVLGVVVDDELQLDPRTDAVIRLR